MRYILRDGVPVVEPDLLKWAKWFEAADRRVEETNIGEVKVSTVFLGIDHSFADEGPPLLYETLVFGGPLDGKMERYPTFVQAKAGHARMVEQVKAAGGYEPPREEEGRGGGQAVRDHVDEEEAPMARAHPLRSEGARLERKAVRAYLRRLLKKPIPASYGPEILTKATLEWVLSRQKRYDPRPGGLGRAVRKRIRARAAKS